MKFVKVNRDDISGKRTHTNIRAMLEEFIKSDMDICELVFAKGEYQDARICASTWNTAAKRYGYYTIRVFCRNGHAYIEKIELQN